MLDYLSKLVILRMHKLETQHAIRFITKVVEFFAKFSQLKRLVLKFPKEVKLLDPLSNLQPWEKHLFGESDEYLVTLSGTKDKITAAERFNI